MKKVIKSILTLLLAVFFAAMSIVPAMAANTRNRIDYVAFGDSLAAGVRGGIGLPGCELGSDYGYTDDIANMLEEAGVLESFNEDFTMSGETAAGLAEKSDVLNDPGTEEWHLIKNAEIVTLDIGANDLLGPLYDYVLPLIADTDSEWYTDQEAVIDNIIEVIIPEIKESLSTGKGLEIQGNIETILQNILNANKKVKIYVAGYYNPLPALSGEPYNVDLNTSVVYLNSLIIAAIKDVLAENKGASIKYVDTMAVMSNALSDGLLVPYDIHPTEAGYQVIADEFWNQIELIFHKGR